MDKININAVDATQSREGAVEALLGVDINGEVRRTNITKLDTYSKSEIDSKDDAIKQYTDLQISALIGGATPENLDTIAKLASALQDDDNSINAINSVLSTKYGPDNKPTAAALDVLPRVNPIANGTMTTDRYVTAGGGTLYNQQGTTTWITNKATSDLTHKGIGVSDTEPVFWDGTTSKPIWHDGNAPVYAKRWPTLAEIGAQPAGSYAAASHTHHVSQIAGLGTAATRNVGTAAGNVMDSQDVRIFGGSNSGITNPDHITSNTITYSTGTAATGLFQDGAIYAQYWAVGKWGHQIYGNYRTGELAVRGLNDTIWTPWRKVWDDGNAPVTAKRWPTPAEVGALPLSGGNINGPLVASGTIRSNSQVRGFGGGNTFTSAGLETGATTAEPSISFHREGAYAGTLRMVGPAWWAFYDQANAGHGSLTVAMLDTTGRIAAAGSIKTTSVSYGGEFRGTNNVDGTGEAIFAPAGIYSKGHNWLYGPIDTNGNPITCGNVTANGIIRGHSFIGEGFNLSRLDWNKLINKPNVANDWINIFNGGIGGRVNKVNIPPQMLNHLKAGRMVEVRAFLNHQGRAGSNRRTMTSIIDGADGWVSYVNDKVSHDMTWYGISSFYVLNASSQHGGDANSFKSQHQNITRIDMRLL